MYTKTVRKCNKTWQKIFSVLLILFHTTVHMNECKICTFFKYTHSNNGYNKSDRRKSYAMKNVF